MVITCVAGVTAAAGTCLAHHFLVELFTLYHSHTLGVALGVPSSRFRAL